MSHRGNLNVIENWWVILVGGLVGILSAVPLLWLSWRIPQQLQVNWLVLRPSDWADPAIRALHWQDVVFVLALSLSAASVTAQWGWGSVGLIAFCYCALLLLLARIDARSGLLPDMLTLPLLWFGLLWHASGLGEPGALGDLSLEQSVWGAAAGYIVLWLPCVLLRYGLGREMMGHGDFKLSAAIGAWLGCAALPYVWLMASAASLLLVVLSSRFRRHGLRDSMPFGPGLALGGILMLFL